MIGLSRAAVASLCGEGSIARIKKNARVEVRVSVAESNGYRGAIIRIWSVTDESDFLPSNVGVSLGIDQVDALIDALGRAKHEAMNRWPK